MRVLAIPTLLIFIGGGTGAVMRFLIADRVQHHLGMGFPWGTLLVNVLGCFGIGFATTWFEQRGLIHPQVRFLLLIGFFGGFTTFSTFGLETWRLMESGQFLAALGNVLGSVVAGLTALYIGLSLAKLAAITPT